MSNTFTELTLHQYRGMANAMKIRIAAGLAGVTVTQKFVTCDQVPEGMTVPYAEFPGFTLSQSNAISRLIAKQTQGLYGANMQEAAMVDQWLEFFKTEVEMNASVVVHQILGHLPFNGQQYSCAGREVENRLAVVERMLEGRDHLVGDNMTLADVTFVTTMLNLYRFYMHKGRQKNLPNCTRVFTALCQNECFAAVLGRVILCEQELHPMKHGKGQKGGKGQGKGKGKGKKGGNQNQGKGKGKGKGGKKGGNQKQQQNGGKKKKPSRPKHWSQMLAPCKTDFNMIAFKTAYQNEEDTRAVFDRMWAQMDFEAYSFWMVEYEPAEGECVDQLKTENLVMLFCQKINKFLKFMFGYMGVYGDEPNLSVQGIWMWRGQDENPEEMKMHPGWEFYKKTRLDAQDPKVREMIMDYWMCWDFDDHKLSDGRMLRMIEILV